MGTSQSTVEEDHRAVGGFRAETKDADEAVAILEQANG